MCWWLISEDLLLPGCLAVIHMEPCIDSFVSALAKIEGETELRAAGPLDPTSVKTSSFCGLLAPGRTCMVGMAKRLDNWGGQTCSEESTAIAIAW